MTSAKALRLLTGTAVVLLVLGGCASSSAGPQGGATFSGPIELVSAGDNGTIGSGEISITVSEDGTGITEASLKLSDLSCSNDAGTITVESDGWSTTMTFVNHSPIEDGKFRFQISNGDDTVSVDGSFGSPTQASATVEISGMQRPPVGQPFTCDYGSWSWSGEAQ